jgi:hypothetical protein
MLLLSCLQLCHCCLAATYEEVQQVQQRIAATLQSVLTAEAVPAVLAGTIAFPGCVHILCTIASCTGLEQQQQQAQQDEAAAALHEEGLHQHLAAVLPGGCLVAAVQHLPGSEAASEETGEAPAAAIALQPAVISLSDSGSSSAGSSMGSGLHQLRLAFAPGLAGKLQQHGYNQLRVIIGTEQHTQHEQLLLFDRCWELQQLRQAAVVEFELKINAATLAAECSRQQQQYGCLSVGVLACRQLPSSSNASSGEPSSSSSSSSSQGQSAQPAELVLGLLPLPLLPPAAAAELRQLQARAEAGDSGSLHVYTSVMLPVLQDLQCAILLYANGGGGAGNGSSSGSSESGSDCSGSDCSARDAAEANRAGNIDADLVMSAVEALHAYFERHGMKACREILHQLRGDGDINSEEQQQHQQRQVELAAAAERLLGKSCFAAWGSCILGALFRWRDRGFERTYAAAAFDAQLPLRWVQAAVLCAVDVAACLLAGRYALGSMLQHTSEVAVVSHAAFALAAACACLSAVAAGLLMQQSRVGFYSSGKAATGLAGLRLAMQLAHAWVFSACGVVGSKEVQLSVSAAGMTAAVAPALVAAVLFGSWGGCLIIVAARVGLHRLLAPWLLLHAGLEAAHVLFWVWRCEKQIETGILEGTPVWLQVLLAAGLGVAVVVVLEARSRLRYLRAAQRRAFDGGVAAVQGSRMTDRAAHMKQE